MEGMFPGKISCALREMKDSLLETDNGYRVDFMHGEWGTGNGIETPG